MCDFEPAMRGHHEYELVAIAVFMAEGDPTVLREALIAYGYDAAQLDEALSRRLLAWTLLHRFGDVAALFEFLPQPPSATLPALARTVLTRRCPRRLGHRCRQTARAARTAWGRRWPS